MEANFSLATRTNRSDATARLAKMQGELAHAWARTDGAALQAWGIGSGADFTRSLSRRVRNVGKLLTRVAHFGVSEVQSAIAAHRGDRLGAHAAGRATAAVVDGGKAFVVGSTEFAKGFARAFSQSPGTVGGRPLAANRCQTQRCHLARKTATPLRGQCDGSVLRTLQ